MPYILLSITLVEAAFKHGGLSLPFLEVSIILFLIFRIVSKPTINIEGVETFYIFAFFWIVSLFVLLLFYQQVQSSGYFTYIPKLAIIPFMAEFFLRERSDKWYIATAGSILFIIAFFVESNPIAIAQLVNKNEFGHYVLCFLALVSLSNLSNNNVQHPKTVSAVYLVIIFLTSILIYSRQFL